MKPEKTALERLREWLDEVKTHMPETAERGEMLINSALAEGLSEANKVIEAKNEYIRILLSEIERTAVYLHVHNMGCSEEKSKQAKLAIQKIEEAEAKYNQLTKRKI